MAKSKFPDLTVSSLQSEAGLFSKAESAHFEKTIFGTTDGKAVGTYLEHKFKAFLSAKYRYETGNSAEGIDFPALKVDMKVTSFRQPQSSCPFKSADQKIFGLGYSLLVFVYNKTDDRRKRKGNLDIRHVIFVDVAFTGDYQTTSGILKLLDNNANEDDLVAYLFERNLPIEEIQARLLAKRVLTNRPKLGYLTISNALQWRLQYTRAIELAGTTQGISRIV